jgi:hypothetical protein
MWEVRPDFYNMQEACHHIGVSTLRAVQGTGGAVLTQPETPAYEKLQAAGVCSRVRWLHGNG